MTTIATDPASRSLACGRTTRWVIPHASQTGLKCGPQRVGAIEGPVTTTGRIQPSMAATRQQTAATSRITNVASHNRRRRWVRTGSGRLISSLAAGVISVTIGTVKLARFPRVLSIFSCSSSRRDPRIHLCAKACRMSHSVRETRYDTAAPQIPYFVPYGRIPYGLISTKRTKSLRSTSWCACRSHRILRAQRGCDQRRSCRARL